MAGSDSHSEIRYIAIEGVIGAGKTSLVQKLSERLKGRIILEQHEENPFLKKFYGDRRSYAFQTQMFFLINRFKQLAALAEETLFDEMIIADYIFEKDHIFAMLNLDGDELALYQSIYPQLEKSLRRPDLVVYLQSDIDRLMANIKKRDRSYEATMQEDYIKELHYLYNEFFFNYKESPILIVNSSKIDFVGNTADFELLYEQIMKKDRAFIEYFQPETGSLFG